MEWDSARWLGAQRERVGGTGSISCLVSTDADAEAARLRRGPLGFGVPRLAQVSLGDLPRAIVETEMGREWGEAVWTASDLRGPPQALPTA